jgi:hypothetical protein
MRLLRYWLGNRSVLIALAVVAVVGGAILTWSWPVAIGVAPIMPSLLPCATMCAIGLCTMRSGNRTCGDDAKRENADPDTLLAATHANRQERAPESE